MKKIIGFLAVVSALAAAVAMPVLAQTTSTPPATTNPSGNAGTQLNLSCAQAAVKTRETALQAAWQTYSSAVQTALSARASALNAAWGNQNARQRRAAILSAWKAYNKAWRTAHQAYRAAVSDAWSAFRTAKSACGIHTSEGDANNTQE